jgi:aerobic-type carbon monoxide dehydrogenase small subunit (CoxS/CutS family)
LVDIFFQAMKKDERGIFIKHALRKAQAISLLNIAVVLRIEKNVVCNATITLGAVAPTIVHAAEAESYLTGKELSKETIAAAAELVEKACKPIDDIRSSARYRAYMGRILSTRALEAIDENHLDVLMPATPILLWGKQNGHHAGIGDQTIHTERGGQAIVTTINGRQCEFKSGSDKTLLRLLREDAGLVGTKEGCAEGECGACTVFLDGKAVMSCMVPAARAHGAQITTIEGVASGDMLHPVQQAFIDEGAVQCGYCTPGFIMSAVKLLEEQPAPTTEQVKQSITGNLCRCTGYYKIVSAIERAARSS